MDSKKTERQQSTPPALPLSAGSSKSAVRRRRFLVAEDDAELRALMALVLRQDGAEVVEVTGGVDLLEWAELTAWSRKDEAFDAIISDIQMPDLTALEVLSQRPAIPRQTPVILVTAYDDKETRQRAYELGAQMVLTKPVQLNDLRAVARSVAYRSSVS